MPGDRDVFREPLGTHDVLPPESDRWQALVAAFATRARRAGFGLVVTPIFEHLEVVQKLGSTTDAVCLCHGSVFDRNGAVVRGPAGSPLQHYQVDVAADGTITIQGAMPVDAAARTAV